MPLTFGRDVKVAIAQETTYAKAWVQPTTGIYHTGLTMDSEIELAIDTFNSGVPLGLIDEIAQGRKDVRLTLSCRVWKEQIGLFLKNMFGTVTSTLQGAGPQWKHIFTLSNTTPTSLRMVIQLADIQYQIRGLVVRRMEIPFTLNNWLMVNMDLIGGDFDTATLGTAPTYASVTGSVEPAYKFMATNWSINAVTTGWSQLTLVVERQYADSPEDSYEAGTVDAGSSNLMRKRLESASENSAPAKVELRITGPRNNAVGSDDGLWTLWKNFTSFENFFHHGTLGNQEYCFHVDLGKCKVMKHNPVRKGMSLVTNDTLIEAKQLAGTFYSSPSTDLKFTIQSTQADTVFTTTS